MRHAYQSLWAATLLAMAGTASAGEIDVMVQNQYLGTDLTPVITSPPELISARVIAALENVAASLPAERLSRLASLIRQRSPHAVVLNEAFVYTCTDLPGTPATAGCGNPRIKGAFVDFLATTEANLGGRYVTKARVRNFAVSGLPFEIDGYVAFLGVADRDAILVRQDLAPFAQPVPLGLNPSCRPSLEGCNYQAVPTLDTALGPVTIERGYAAVDLLLGGQPYRIFGTHLEVRQIIPGSDPLALSTRTLQRMQAAELQQVAGAFPALPDTRKLIVGDINSAATDGMGTIPTLIGPLQPPYAIFAGGGYTDVWTLRPGTASGKGAPLVGNSCCQDEDLGNHTSALYERIDIIFSSQVPRKVFNARLLGEAVSDKTSPRGWGVWPSDHASVAARIQY
jgi:hypothetical protein